VQSGFLSRGHISPSPYSPVFPVPVFPPNLRRSTRASPFSGPVRIQTDNHLFPTSIPAQRSTAAQIIVISFSYSAGEQLTSIEISSSTARLLHSGIPHVNPTNFVYGTNGAPLLSPVLFSCCLQTTPFAHARPAPFSSPGGGRSPGHPISFRNLPFSHAPGHFVSQKTPFLRLSASSSRKTGYRGLLRRRIQSEIIRSVFCDPVS